MGRLSWVRGFILRIPFRMQARPIQGNGSRRRRDMLVRHLKSSTAAGGSFGSIGWKALLDFLFFFSFFSSSFFFFSLFPFFLLRPIPYYRIIIFIGSTLRILSLFLSLSLSLALSFSRSLSHSLSLTLFLSVFFFRLTIFHIPIATRFNSSRNFRLSTIF